MGVCAESNFSDEWLGKEGPGPGQVRSKYLDNVRLEQLI